MRMIGVYMAKSALFKYYSDKLARVKSPEELQKLAKEITTKSFRASEKAALAVSCMFIAKQFDKKAAKSKVGVTDETVPLVCAAEE